MRERLFPEHLPGSQLISVLHNTVTTRSCKLSKETTTGSAYQWVMHGEDHRIKSRQRSNQNYARACRNNARKTSEDKNSRSEIMEQNLNNHREILISLHPSSWKKKDNPLSKHKVTGHAERPRALNMSSQLTTRAFWVEYTNVGTLCQRHCKVLWGNYVIAVIESRREYHVVSQPRWSIRSHTKGSHVRTQKLHNQKLYWATSGRTSKSCLELANERRPKIRSDHRR